MADTITSTATASSGSGIELTSEDLAIAQRLGATAHHEMTLGDRIDFRAMLAREVESERAWRIRGLAVTPAMLVRYELPGLNLRIKVERESGEALA